MREKYCTQCKTYSSLECDAILANTASYTAFGTAIVPNVYHDEIQIEYPINEALRMNMNNNSSIESRHDTTRQSRAV